MFEPLTLRYYLLMKHNHNSAFTKREVYILLLLLNLESFKAYDRIGLGRDYIVFLNRNDLKTFACPWTVGRLICQHYLQDFPKNWQHFQIFYWKLIKIIHNSTILGFCMNHSYRNSVQQSTPEDDIALYQLWNFQPAILTQFQITVKNSAQIYILSFQYPFSLGSFYRTKWL